jgi:hypothetical protein
MHCTKNEVEFVELSVDSQQHDDFLLQFLFGLMKFEVV